MDLGRKLYNQLLNEAAKYNRYTRGNNSEGTIIAVPSFQNLIGYNKEFRRSKSIIDDIVKVIAKISKSHHEEACEAFLTGLFNKYQDVFPPLL